jgi:hypothetical protein
VEKSEVRWAELDVGVEQATKVHYLYESSSGGIF